MFKKESKTERLHRKYLSAQNNLMREIRKLENYGSDCTHEITDYCEVIDYYGHDDFPSAGRHCLRCGGDVPI